MSNTSMTTGADGIVPISNPNGTFHIWALNEVYQGPTSPGLNRYVPNVSDRVIDLDTNDWYKITVVDPTTFVPTLLLITNAIPVDNFTDNDILLGVGPGTPSDTYRVYIDKSVLPYTLCVDARLQVAGSAADSCILYTGSQTDNSAVAVSAIYDQSGNLLGQNIPLELVAMANGNNIAVKTVTVCHTNANLLDGEIITAVIYSATGNVVSKRQLLVENTAFIRSTDTSIKYITSISLESPFLSQSDNTLIQYPINVPLNGLMLTGVVTYSDGSQIRMPVDGTKFRIDGFAGYIATQIGQKFKLVLKYNLSPGEIVYGATNIDGQSTKYFMTANYKATTLKASGAFSVKLYAYPVWIDNLNGYRLEWYMYTLDRALVYNVTPYVHYNLNSQQLQPVNYGAQQTLSVYINMQDIDATFTNYKNVQTINVTLVAPATVRSTNWTIGFTPGQNPPFGVNNFAASTMTSTNALPPVVTWQVNIASGSITLDDWLNRMYYATLPLTDSTTEAGPPVPNMFSLSINGADVEFPISAWNTTITVPGAVPDTSTLLVKFFKRLPQNDLQLSCSALPVYQM